MIEGIFLLLGSNLGDKKTVLANAREKINQEIGPVTQTSALYETAAWGKTDQPSFYNQVVEVQSSMPPEKILKKINAIEEHLGRVRHEKWGARIIDIDILYYNTTVLESEELTIPHPGIPERRFTLIPLVELAPDFIHPTLRKSNSQLLIACTDTLDVQKVEE